MLHNLSLIEDPFFTESDDKFENLISELMALLTEQPTDPWAMQNKWDTTPELRELMRGEIVNFGNESVPYLCTLTLKKRLEIFQAALSNQCQYIASEIWSGDPVLRIIYPGYPHVELSPTYCFSDSEILANFRLVLTSHNMQIIYDFWNGNHHLHTLISMLDHIGSFDFLLAVLNSNLSGTAYYIQDFINKLTVNNLPVINAAIAYLEASSQDNPSENSIGYIIKSNLLKARVEELANEKPANLLNTHSSATNGTDLNFIPQNRDDDFSRRHRPRTNKPKPYGGVFFHWKQPKAPARKEKESLEKNALPESKR